MSGRPRAGCGDKRAAVSLPDIVGARPVDDVGCADVAITVSQAEAEVISAAAASHALPARDYALQTVLARAGRDLRMAAPTSADPAGPDLRACGHVPGASAPRSLASPIQVDDPTLHAYIISAFIISEVLLAGCLD